jgi:hypothetical protein
LDFLIVDRRKTNSKTEKQHVVIDDSVQNGRIWENFEKFVFEEDGFSYCACNKLLVLQKTSNKLLNKKESVPIFTTGD